MPIYTVTHRQSGAEITRYAAMSPVEQIDALSVPFVDYDHTELPEDGVVDAPITAWTWTKLAFERLFTDVEWDAAQSFNANFENSVFLTSDQKLKIRRGLNDYRIATEICSTDVGTVTLLGIYEACGVIAPGRAAEILGGA